MLVLRCGRSKASISRRASIFFLFFIMARIYLSVDEGYTDCTPTGCPFYGEDGCSILKTFDLDCNKVDLSTLRRCDEGEVVAVK